MTDTSLSAHAWWLASRSAGLMALILVTVSAGMALAVASRLIRKPGLSVMHQQLAVCAIFMIGLHGVTLLGDPWLHPTIVGIAVPFSLSYRPLWTGLGIIGGYVATVFGLSFYVRRRIGTRFWRSAHRLIIVAYALAVAHALGAGTDASTPWLRAWIVVTAPVIVALFLYRAYLSVRRRSARRGRASMPAPHSGAAPRV